MGTSIEERSNSSTKLNNNVPKSIGTKLTHFKGGWKQRLASINKLSKIVCYTVHVDPLKWWIE